MRRDARWGLRGLPWMAVLFVVGCGRAHDRRSEFVGANPYLIFNPSPGGHPLAEAYRSEWPATEAPYLGESLEYVVIVHDELGRFPGRDDYYRRRFDAYTVGWSAR